MGGGRRVVILACDAWLRVSARPSLRTRGAPPCCHRLTRRLWRLFRCRNTFPAAAGRRRPSSSSGRTCSQKWGTTRACCRCWARPPPPRPRPPPPRLHAPGLSSLLHRAAAAASTLYAVVGSPALAAVGAPVRLAPPSCIRARDGAAPPPLRLPRAHLVPLLPPRLGPLQSLKESLYFKPFEDAALQFEVKLAALDEYCQNLNSIQRRCVCGGGGRPRATSSARRGCPGVAAPASN
jgi:hypothetical protein